MADDDEVCADLFGDGSDLTSGFSHAEPRRWREAHGLEPLHAFRQDPVVHFSLFADRDGEPSLQRSGAGRNFHHSQQKNLGAAELRDSGSLPQGPPSFDRAVIGEKNFPVQEILPSFSACPDRSLAPYPWMRLPPFCRTRRLRRSAVAVWHPRWKPRRAFGEARGNPGTTLRKLVLSNFVLGADGAGEPAPAFALLAEALRYRR